MSAEVAYVDPVDAKAFELRRFALDIRRKLDSIEDVDRLRELETVLIGARRRLRQLNEDVIEAERTRVLVVQRIGVLLGPATIGPKPGTVVWDAERSLTKLNRPPITQQQSSADHVARTLAAYPSIVERAIAGERVTVSKVFALCKTERARESAAAAESAERPHYDVQRGQWWELGEHRLYCGDSRDAGFIERVRKAEPVFAFADPPMDVEKGVPLWTHDYLIDFASVVAVTPGIPWLVDFAQLTGMPYRWMLAAGLVEGKALGALGTSSWIPVYLYARHDRSLTRPVIRLPVPNGRATDFPPTIAMDRAAIGRSAPRIPSSDDPPSSEAHGDRGLVAGPTC